MNDFTFHTPETASDEGREILNQVKQGYGFIPNLFGYMAEAPATVEAYVELTKLMDKISLTPQQSQVALLAISQENGCDFCTVAHRAVGKMKGSNKRYSTPCTIKLIFAKC